MSKRIVVVVKAVSNKGKTRIADHGKLWSVFREVTSVDCREGLGPAFKLVSMKKGPMVTRWMSQENDPDFEIVEMTMMSDVDYNNLRWGFPQSANGKDLLEGQLVIYNLSGELAKGVVKKVNHFQARKAVIHIHLIDGERGWHGKKSDHISKVRNTKGIWVLD